MKLVVRETDSQFVNAQVNLTFIIINLTSEFALRCEIFGTNSCNMLRKLIVSSSAV